MPRLSVTGGGLGDRPGWAGGRLGDRPGWAGGGLGDRSGWAGGRLGDRADAGLSDRADGAAVWHAPSAAA